MKLAPLNAVTFVKSESPAPTNAMDDPGFLPWTPSRYDAIGVVVVAHNREREIESCVNGIFAATHHNGWHKPLWIVIVADDCTDRTARAARPAVSAFGEVLTIAAKGERRSRVIGADAIRRHFPGIASQWILLSHVSAGGRIPADFFERQLRLRAANECHYGSHRV